ncbi:CdaR family protein [Limisalsivibrio acetivorans]|uniref:CdaR family protein n=1 Tax=Limisalsivibrio acetivorans TaxID=1304888 RepID=UPI0003B4453C|nr:CdaR family protein [Limisalsivibrio acetivorans]
MTKNIHLKILSVIIALALWFSLVSGEYQEFSVYAPVKLKNMQEDYVAVTDDSHVTIVAKAPRATVKNIDYNGIAIEVDVSKLNPGDTYHRLDESEIKIPPGMQIVRVEPEGISITVDTLIKKSVEVIPTFIGDPHPGFKVGTISVFPETVEIEGARKKLTAVSSVETLPVNISGRSSSITYSIGMKETDGVKSFYPEQVEVVVSFKENIVEETVEDIKVTPVNLPEGFSAEVTDNVTVKVRGRNDLLVSDYINDKFKFFVDMSETDSAGKYLKEVSYREFKGFEILSIQPTRVRLMVEKDEGDSR